LVLAVMLIRIVLRCCVAAARRRPTTGRPSAIGPVDAARIAVRYSWTVESTTAPLGFWSYAHADNAASHGDVVALANRLSAEFDLLTGRQLHIFIDRSHIDWGEVWRERVATGLMATTFFIPVITPRYFAREECRREFRDFLAHAKSLGLEEFLLPILYVPVTGLVEDSNDELVAIVARTQFVDWTKMRLLDVESPGYRRELNSLAVRLAQIEEKLSEVQISNEVEIAQLTSIEDRGVIELAEAVNEHLPKWTEAVLRNQTSDSLESAAFNTYQQQRKRLPRTAAFAALMRYADAVEPIVENSVSDAKEYSALSIAIDSDVMRLIRLASGESELADVTLAPLRSAVQEVISVLIEDERRSREGGLQQLTFFRNHAHLSRRFANLARTREQYERYAREGNQVAVRWARELGIPTEQIEEYVRLQG